MQPTLINITLARVEVMPKAIEMKLVPNLVSSNSRIILSSRSIPLPAMGSVGIKNGGLGGGGAGHSLRYYVSLPSVNNVDFSTDSKSKSKKDF